MRGTRTVRGVTAFALVMGASLFVAPSIASAASDDGAVLSNGTVQLGVTKYGTLNYDCEAYEESGCPGPSTGGEGTDGPTNTSVVGLRYEPQNLEGVADGSPTEGWGVGDAGSGVSGYASQSQTPDVATNMDLLSFEGSDDTATSRVLVSDPSVDETQSLEVTQEFQPSAQSPNAFQATITIANTGSDVADLRYRRTVDWDIEPTPYNEWVTIAGSSAKLRYTSDDGFASPNPLSRDSADESGAVCDDQPCYFKDLGAGGVYPDTTLAADHGALLDFKLGALPAGQSITLTMFYGAAASETEAVGALNAVGAEVYSLGESACTGDTVDTCDPTDPGDSDGGGCDGTCEPPPCSDCGGGEEPPPFAAPFKFGPRAAALDPGDPAGLDQGKPATFFLGFVLSEADLAVEQSDDPDPVLTNGEVTYDVAVTNNGPDDAAGAQLVDEIPSGSSLVSIDPDTLDCGQENNTLTCALGTIPANTTRHVKITVTAPGEEGGMTNLARVSSSSADDSQRNNSSSESTEVNAPEPPEVTDDEYDTKQGVTLTVPTADGVLANDTDPQGGTLTVGETTSPSHGTVTFDDDSAGGFTYVPADPDYVGDDTFTYTATNGAQTSEPATVTIHLLGNHDPVAVDNSYSVDEDDSLDADPDRNLLGNDTDEDGGELTAAIASGATNGTATVNADGTFTYTPAPNFHGTDSFTYTATDPDGNSDVATVTITVNSVPDDVDAVDDDYTVVEDTTLTVPAPGVLGNDILADDETITASVVTTPTHGSLVLDSNGRVVYAPDANYSGLDSFTYRASNGTNSDTATVTISVQGRDDPPVAQDDEYFGDEDQTLTADVGIDNNDGVLANDSDPDGDTLMAQLVSGVGSGNGTLTFNSNGSFRYTPPLNFHGTVTFTYRALAGTQRSGIATVTLHIQSVNDAPVAVNDDYTVEQDKTLDVSDPGVLGNDTDVDGDELSAHLYDGPDSDPKHGTVELNEDGSFTYTPNPGFVGTDTFEYNARNDCDCRDRVSDQATVTITVTKFVPPNRAPVAKADSYTTEQDTRLTIAAPGVKKNDSDPDGNSLSAVKVSNPAHGTLTLKSGGGFAYTPEDGYSGTDSFRYRVTDGALNSNTVTDRITVTASPTTPTTPPTTPTTPTKPTTPTTPVTPDGPTQTNEPPVQPPTDVPTPDIPTDEPTEPTQPPSSTPKGNFSDLTLSAPSINPGGDLTASGKGCAGKSTVVLTIDGTGAGSGRAKDDGSFAVPIAAPQLPIGNHTVTATCNGRVLTAPVSFVSVTSDSSAPGARAITVAAMLAFFMLLLGLTLRRPTS